MRIQLILDPEHLIAIYSALMLQCEQKKGARFTVQGRSVVVSSEVIEQLIMDITHIIDRCDVPRYVLEQYNDEQ